MNTLDIAMWLSIAGAFLAVVGLFLGLVSYRKARRLRQNLPDSEFETAIHVVVVAPEEERRYFLSVPPGLSSSEIVQRLGKALEEAEIENVHTEVTQSPAQPGAPAPPPAPRPGSPSQTPTTETTARLADPDTRRHPK